MANTYGVDTSKPYYVYDVRGAVFGCFAGAHTEFLEKDVGEFSEEIFSDELEKIKRINVLLMIKRYFKEFGGDYEKPTKNSIIAVCDKLAEFSRNLSDSEIIKKHYKEIMSLADV